MVEPEFRFTAGKPGHFINQHRETGTYWLAIQTRPRLDRIRRIPFKGEQCATVQKFHFNAKSAIKSWG